MAVLTGRIHEPLHAPAQDPVVRALQDAPVVPWTEDEERAFAEAEAGPVLSHDEVLRRLAERPDSE